MKHLPAAFVIAIALQTTAVWAQYDPHPKNVTYNESFRGQFHFSPKSEWMNDINALMYHDGKYHMIYQWGKKIRHGGYATSKDLLAGVKSKTFDLTAVFDLKETLATEIAFRIANVPLQYDIKAQMFHGMRAHKHRFVPIPNKPRALKPDANGLLKIRMLVDWSQLEVFSAGGVFSYSANLPFTPKDSSLGLTAAGGGVKLVSMTMNEVGRTWPKASE